VTDPFAEYVAGVPKIAGGIAAYERIFGGSMAQQSMFDTVARHEQMLDVIARQQRFIDVVERTNLKKIYAMFDPLAPHQVTLTAMRRLHEQQATLAALAPIRQHERLVEALDPLRTYLEAAKSLTRAQFYDFVVAMPGDHIDEDVAADLDAALSDSAGTHDHAPLASWFSRLSPQQRRVILRPMLNLLWTLVILGAVSSDVDVPEELTASVAVALGVVEMLVAVMDTTA
jgi:hypothetical protein